MRVPTDPATPQGELLRELGAAKARKQEACDASLDLMRLADDPLLIHGLLRRAEQRSAARPAGVKLPLINQMIDRNSSSLPSRSPPYSLAEPLHLPSLAAETFASSREDREQALTIGPEQVPVLPRRQPGWIIFLLAAALLLSAVLVLAHV